MFLRYGSIFATPSSVSLLRISFIDRPLAPKLSEIVAIAESPNSAFVKSTTSKESLMIPSITFSYFWGTLSLASFFLLFLTVFCQQTIEVSTLLMNELLQFIYFYWILYLRGAEVIGRLHREGVKLDLESSYFPSSEGAKKFKLFIFPCIYISSWLSLLFSFLHSSNPNKSSSSSSPFISSSRRTGSNT